MNGAKESESLHWSSLSDKMFKSTNLTLHSCNIGEHPTGCFKINIYWKSMRQNQRVFFFMHAFFFLVKTVQVSLERLALSIDELCAPLFWKSHFTQTEHSLICVTFKLAGHRPNQPTKTDFKLFISCFYFFVCACFCVLCCVVRPKHSDIKVLFWKYLIGHCIILPRCIIVST